MKQSVDLYSPLAPEALATKLKAIMDDDMPDASARVYGGGSQFDMELRYVRCNVRDSSVPSLSAKLTAYGGGTRIAGDITTPASAKFFPIFWFGFLSIFILVGLAVMLTVPGMLLFGLMFIGIPVLMMVIGGFVFRSMPDTARDGDEILAFLRRELDARPVIQGAADLPRG